MTTLEKLLSEYEAQIKIIHTNRGVIRGATERNQDARNNLDKIKEKMRDYIMKKMGEGKSLYVLCQEEFGKVDRRFHVLFALFREQ